MCLSSGSRLVCEDVGLEVANVFLYVQLYYIENKWGLYKLSPVTPHPPPSRIFAKKMRSVLSELISVTGRELVPSGATRRLGTKLICHPFTFCIASDNTCV